MGKTSIQNLHKQSSRLVNRQGNIVVLSALSLAMVIAFVAFSVDLGRMMVTQSELQNAADSGALSGARALSNGHDAAKTAAENWANKNMAANVNVEVVTSEDVEVGIWDFDLASFTTLAPTDTEKPNAVRLTCRRTTDRGNPLKLFFAPLLGIDNGDVSASAIAISEGGSCGGIMALEKIYLNDRQVSRASYTDSYDSTVGDYHSTPPGTNGDICTNGHLTLNGSSNVNGDARWWDQGKDPKATESQVSGVLESFEDPIDFPPIDPGNAATVNNNSNVPISSTGKQVLTGTRFQLGHVPAPTGKPKKGKVAPPEADLTPDFVTLPPGTYYFSEMVVGKNSVVTVTGPTYIYVEGTIDLRWGAIDNTTKSPINLQIYPMGVDSYCYLPFFGELHSVIYSTTAHIYLDEKNEPVSFDFFGKMVGQKIRVWDTGLHIDESIRLSNLKSGSSQVGYGDGTVLVD